MPFATTKLSSKGQVVIPEEIRARLKLKAGVNFMVLGRVDTIFLKVLEKPPIDRFVRMMDEAAEKARKGGLKKTAVKGAIRQARRKNK